MNTKHLFSLLLAALLGWAAPAMADHTADSLRQVVNAAQGKQKTTAFNQLHNHYYNQGLVEQDLRMLDEWMAFEQQQGDNDMEGKVRWRKIVLLSNFDLNEALLEEAPLQMTWFEQHQQWENYYNTWDSKAGAYLYSERLQTALHEAQLMLADAQQRDNDFGRVVSYQLSGMIYENMNQAKQAVEHLQKALDLVSSLPSTSDIRFSVYDYLSQALSSDNQYERELDITNQWQDAIIAYRQLEGNGPTTLRGSELTCLVQRANALMQLHRYALAEQNLDEAERRLQEVDIPITRYRVNLCRAQLLSEQGSYQQALALFDSLAAMGNDMGGSLKRQRADVLMKLRRFEEAATLYKSEYDRQDSIYNREMRTQLDELATLYKLDEQETLDQMARDRQRNLFLMILAGVVVLALLGFVVYRSFTSKQLAQTNRSLEEANKQLAEARQRAEDSSKMKTNFIKSISHEIRTPLNILSGFTQVITTPGMNLPADELADIHKRINENTDRIVGLVNKMLELSDSNNRDSIAREDQVEAAAIVDDALRRTGLKSTDQVKLAWQPRPDLAATVLTTHRKYAVRALTCLLENAQKFTPKGIITIALTKEEQRLVFAVADTGIGIPADQTERIFDEFVQLDPYSDGAGIGLTVARSIARRLGGDIRLDHTGPTGSRFSMWLPLQSN